MYAMYRDSHYIYITEARRRPSKNAAFHSTAVGRGLIFISSIVSLLSSDSRAYCACAENMGGVVNMLFAAV